MNTNGIKSSEFKLGAAIAMVITILEVVSQSGLLGAKWSAFFAQIVLAAGALGYTGARTYFKSMAMLQESRDLSLKAKPPQDD